MLPRNWTSTAAAILVLCPLLSCSKQSTQPVRPQCTEMGESATTATLLQKFGEPGEKKSVKEAPGLQIWLYRGSDGTCLVAVLSNGKVASPSNFVPK